MKNSLILECSCNGKHYLQVDHWVELTDPDISISFIEEPSSLWNLLKHWWRHRNACISEAILQPEQVDKLMEFLANVRKEKK